MSSTSHEEIAEVKRITFGRHFEVSSNFTTFVRFTWKGTYRCLLILGKPEEWFWKWFR